jgi:hypothetical protein
MIKANVIFFGSDKDEYGMPKPYNSYFVVCLPGKLRILALPGNPTVDVGT